MTMRQRLAHTALGGVLVLSGVIASSLLQTSDAQQSDPGIVKAREFHIVNENGTTTAVIAPYTHPGDSGGYGLVVQSADGKPGLLLLIDTETSPGGKLALFNDKGKEALHLASRPNGEGEMSVNNAAGRSLATIGADTDGGLVAVRSLSGVAGAGLSARAAGSGLVMIQPNGRKGAVIDVGPDGGKLSLLNSKGGVGMSVVAESDSGGGIVSVMGKHGDVQIMANEKGGDVKVYRQDGANGGEKIH